MSFFIANEEQRALIMEKINNHKSLVRPVRNSEVRGGITWTKPSKKDVQALIDVLNVSDPSLGVRLGYDAKTISRWRGFSASPSPIPYLAWRELCFIVLDTLAVVE